MGIERGSRRGQALAELAMGMFALALVLSALFAMVRYIIVSLDIQRDLRADSGRSALSSVGSAFDGVERIGSDSVTVEPLAAEYLFGSETVPVRERVFMPSMMLIR